MSTPKHPENLFLHRAPGEKAVPISRGSARAEEAVRAVLHAHDGRVLVKGIQRQADGTFSGLIYGVMPGQTSVAVGDVVQFEESQIFRFRASEIPEYDVPEGEMAEMVRSFDEWWKQTDPGAIKDADVLDALDAGPAFDIRLPEDAIEPAPAPAPIPPAPADAPRSAPAPRAPVVKEEISLGEAYSILGASNPEVKDPRGGRVEPRVEVPPRVVEEIKPRVEIPPRVVEEIKPRVEIPPRVVEEIKPRVEVPPRVVEEVKPRVVEERKPAVAEEIKAPVTPREPAPVAETPVTAERRISCVECGATLIVPPVPPGAEAPAKVRVSCRQCGRINDVKP